jgi:hypothetical protein
MKNITILLLTLLVLSSCSSELERCIEANVVIDEDHPTFSLGWFIVDFKHRGDFHACLSEDPTAMEYRSKRSELFDQERSKEVSGITDKELKDFERQGKIIDDKFLSDLKRSWKNCEEVYKRKAEKICNSQGIY